MSIFLSPDTWLSLITLTTLELVLGADNLVMLSILVSGLPKDKQDAARKLGLAFALITRVILLCGISWLVGLVKPFFYLFSHPFSMRDLVVIVGGGFLIYKGSIEIYNLWSGKHSEAHAAKGGVFWVAFQIALFDIIFSIDSVFTAVGLSRHLPVMIIAIVIAMAFMLFFSGFLVKMITAFISVKVLALAFVVLIGVHLFTGGFNIHIPKEYLYTAMGFSALVEVLIILINRRNPKAA
ncbi:MAG: TerC family protein [Deferribacteraceae bacterium]|jgi:predicted tellurium resistance membrane protein TerC|nr:TerC family protein [Deferribacteraceae bacterium]